MKRLLTAAVALLCACGMTAFAQTPVTGNGAQINGATVTHGSINMWIADGNGQPVNYINAAGAQKASGFTASVTGGIIGSGLTVQDLCLATPVNPSATLSYTAYLYNSDTQQGGAITGIKNVCGTSAFSLNSYFAGTGATPSVTGLLSGSTAQTPATCTAPAAYIDQTLNVLKGCVGGVFASVAGGGGGGNAATITIGSVTQGTTPAASLTSGANNSYALNLVLPQGAAGSTPVLTIGSVTQGTAAASLTAGANNSYALNLVLPAGTAGATPTFTIGTVTQGSSAAASLTAGANNSYTLNLTLPSGGSGSAAPSVYLFANFPTTGMSAGQLIYQSDWSNGTTCTAGTGTVRSDTAQRLCRYISTTNGVATYATADAVLAEKSTAATPNPNGVIGADLNGKVPNALLNPATTNSAGAVQLGANAASNQLIPLATGTNNATQSAPNNSLNTLPATLTNTAYPGLPDYTSNSTGDNSRASQNPTFTVSYLFNDSNVPTANASGSGGAQGFGHGFADNNIFNRSASDCVTLNAFPSTANGGTSTTSSPGCGYSSYDARTIYTGSNNYNHYVAYQSGAALGANFTGTLDQWYGINASPAIYSGTLNNYISLHVSNAYVTGSGLLKNSYGLWIDPLTSGTGTNTAIYVAGSNNLTYLGGPLQVAGNVLNTLNFGNTSTTPATGLSWGGEFTLSRLQGNNPQLATTNSTNPLLFDIKANVAPASGGGSYLGFRLVSVNGGTTATAATYFTRDTWGASGVTKPLQLYVQADGNVTGGMAWQTIATGAAMAWNTPGGTKTFYQNESYTVGAAVASASTITPTGMLFHITGTTAIGTINLPVGYSSTQGGCIDVIADGAWSTTNSGGNIASSITATAGTRYRGCFDGSKWYIN